MGNTGRTRRRRRRNRKTRAHLRKTTLTDLPIEILEQITGNLSIWHKQHVRATCSKLKHIADNIVLRHMRKSLNEAVPQTADEQVFYKVIHQLTWPYTRTGCESILSGVILSMTRHCSAFRSRVSYMEFFINKFFRLAEEHIGSASSQKSRLLYIITLLGFMHKSPNTELESSKKINDERLQYFFKVKGSWFGLLWSTVTSYTLDYSTDRNALLKMLTDVMVSARNGRPFRKVLEDSLSEKIFIYGSDVEIIDKPRSPRIDFEFNIAGSKTVLDFLEKVPIDEEWTGDLPSDEFHVSVVLSCKQAIKWGCLPAYRFTI